MEEFNRLNRQTKFAILSSIAAGIVSVILITFFIDMLNWLFIPSVMIMVFISAYFAFQRQMRNKRELNARRISGIAFEVGTVTHFYTFALYLPLVYLTMGGPRFSGEMIGTYLFALFVGGLCSLIMFVWIAVPMYIGVGHIQKAMERNMDFDKPTFNDSLLDDEFAESEIKPSSIMELD